MNKKSFFSIAIFTMIIFTIVNIPINATNTQAEFSVSDAKGNVGEIVSLEFNLDTLEQNTKFVSYEFTITYPSDKLEFVGNDLDFTNGSILSTGTGMIFPNYSVDGKITIAGTNLNGVDITGLLSTLKFKIKDGATGSIDVVASIEELYDSNSMAQPIVVTNSVSNGTITVKSPLISINLNKLTTEMNEGQTETLTVKYNPENTTDNKTVVWTSSNETIATVDSNGKVTALKAGSTTITANVNGKIAECIVTVKSPLISISLDDTNVDLLLNQSQILNVIYNPIDTTDDKTVVWTSSDETIATVDSNGKVTALKVGTVKVTATVGTYSAISTVEVKEMPLDSIEINQINISMLKGETTQVYVLYNPENTTDDKTVVWTSSDETIATVDSNGNIVAVKEGVVTITATIGNKTATTEVVVNEISVEKISIDISKIEKFEVGKKYNLKLIINPLNTTDAVTITWTSSDESIATISAEGVLTILKEGIVTITANVNDKITDTIEIKVKSSDVIDTPQTGDINIYLIVGMFITCLGVTVVLVIKNKLSK